MNRDAWHRGADVHDSLRIRIDDDNGRLIASYSAGDLAVRPAHDVRQELLRLQLRTTFLTEWLRLYESQTIAPKEPTSGT